MTFQLFCLFKLSFDWVHLAKNILNFTSTICSISGPSQTCIICTLIGLPSKSSYVSSGRTQGKLDEGHAAGDTLQIAAVIWVMQLGTWVVSLCLRFYPKVIPSAHMCHLIREIILGNVVTYFAVIRVVHSYSSRLISNSRCPSPA